MKVPLSWLQKYIRVEKDPKVIAEILTLAGLEVDKIDRMEFAFSGVVFGKIITVSPHPDAPSLHVVEITDGKKKYTVVSSAQNLKPNLVTAFAKVGSTLLDGDKKPYTIERVKVKGMESSGMLPSERELGLSSDQSGVLEFPHDSPLGESIVSSLYDPVFDIALTPNLGYCRSIVGIARELGAHIKEEVELPEVALEDSTGTMARSKLQVSNEAHDGCFQYMCRVIQGVEIEASPRWLVDWLEKSGYTSINNVVDITHFVMHELGQPMHAFDYEMLKEKHLIVRKAGEGEFLTTLDDTQREIPPGTLIIADGDTPVAIAGIMGGEETSISQKTHTVVLESAHFKDSFIRQASKKLGLRTEASARFENGIDPQLVRFALSRAADLIQEICGGRVLQGVLEQSPKAHVPRFVTCRLSRINELLGTSFGLNEVESYLIRLGMVVSSDNVDLFQIKIPSWRSDIKEEIDIVEEVARIFGYNHIPRKAPRHVTTQTPHHPLYLLESKVRSHLVACGLQEFLTCDLISPDLCDLEIENGLFNPEYIEVLHAKSKDQSVLRPSLLPGLLTAIQTNQNHGTFDIKAFEIGRIHFKEGASYDEKPSLGIVLVGKETPMHWERKPHTLSFYDLKGVIESIEQALLLPKIRFEASLLKTFHPGRQARLSFGEDVFGVMGEVHPSSLEKLDIRGRVLFAEIDLLTLEKYRSKKALFAKLPEFPSSERDWTITLPREAPMQPLFDALEELNSPLLKEASLIDVYMGEQVSPEEKNVTFRFIYRDDRKTLDVESIEEAHDLVIHHLQKVF